MEDFVTVASVSDLSDGEIMLVEVGDERIALAKIDGSFYAIGDECPHAEGPLSEGDVEGNEVECPYHGSRFNLMTGDVTSPPAGEGVTRYAVRLDGDDVLVGPA